MNDLKRELYDHLLHQPVSEFAHERTGSLVNRFSADAGIVENGLVISVPAGLLALAGIVFSAALLLHIAPLLAAISFSGLVLCFLLPRAVEAPAERASLRHREVEGEVAGRVQETLGARSLIKAFGLEGRQAGRFRQQLQALFQTSVRSSFFCYLVQRLPNLSFLLLQLLVLGVGGAMAAAEQLSVGDLVCYQVLLFGLSAAVNNLTWVLPSLIGASASLERILGLLRAEARLSDPADPRPLPPLSQAVAFEHVSFAYAPGRTNLHDVSFRIPHGSFAAFVGPSGAGKSTLINLLLRFYDPGQGRVTLDGVDVRDVRQSELRAKIGVVFQDVVLLDDTIGDNIRLGLAGATDADVEAAARAAEVHDAILRLPRGYNTPVGERGCRLSGGERQRIALARALIRDPEILILDEATSALDPQTEADILSTLRRVARGRTVLAITHRPALAAHADLLFALENGRLRRGDFIAGHLEHLKGPGNHESLRAPAFV
jgi:ATP-binding cassette subfamily B protein